MEDIKELREKALKLEGVSDFGLSRRKGKRFYVLYNGVKIGLLCLSVGVGTVTVNMLQSLIKSDVVVKDNPILFSFN